MCLVYKSLCVLMCLVWTTNGGMCEEPSGRWRQVCCCASVACAVLFQADFSPGAMLCGTCMR